MRGNLQSEMLIWKMLVCFVVTILIFGINAFLPSHLNGFPEKGRINLEISTLISNETADEIYKIRTEDLAFKNRRLMSSLQRSLGHIGMPYQLSFNILNFTSCVIFLFIWMQFFFSQTKSEYLKCLLFCSLNFGLVFAFLGTIHTYDDILQYMLLCLMGTALHRGNDLLAGCLFFICMICRETSIIFIFPIICYYIYKGDRPKILLFVLAAGAYFAYLKYSVDSNALKGLVTYGITNRSGAILYNFSTFRESIYVTLAVLFIPVSFLFEKLKNGNVRIAKYLLIFVVSNTILVFLTALAREARLIFIPLLIVLPLVKDEILNFYDLICSRLRLDLILLSLGIASFICFGFYRSDLGGTGVVFRVYGLFYFSIGFYFLSKVFESITKSRRSAF